jgi:hypothetical protein
MTPEQRSEYNQCYRERHRDRLNAANAVWREANKERHCANAKQWQQDNSERYRANQKRWKATNRDYSRAYYHSTERRRLTVLLRACLRGALISRGNGARRARVWRSDSKIARLLGCTKGELVAHIEAQFALGMTWGNYGRDGWEIDHIKPCAAFDLTDLRQQALCFHYTNLRPLWRADNLSRPKGSA